MENIENLEIRMYFLVLYNISEIQKGIQAGHAALEYANVYGNTPMYKNFIDNHKTWIILNGGTSNEKGYSIYSDDFIGVGSMESYLKELMVSDIDISLFREPDLNNALSAICFLADERVFNKKTYPNLFEYYIHNFSGELDNIEHCPNKPEVNITKYNAKELIPTLYPKFYKKWVNMLGGEKNLYLREFLQTKKLA